MCKAAPTVSNTDTSYRITVHTAHCMQHLVCVVFRFCLISAGSSFLKYDKFMWIKNFLELHNFCLFSPCHNPTHLDLSRPLLLTSLPSFPFPAGTGEHPYIQLESLGERC